MKREGDATGVPRIVDLGRPLHELRGVQRRDDLRVYTSFSPNPQRTLKNDSLVKKNVGSSFALGCIAFGISNDCQTISTFPLNSFWGDARRNFPSLFFKKNINDMRSGIEEEEEEETHSTET